MSLLVFRSADTDRSFRVERLPGAGEAVLGESGGAAPGGKGLDQAVSAARDGAAGAMPLAAEADRLAGAASCG